jgi:putative sterol carrier protein
MTEAGGSSPASNFERTVSCRVTDLAVTITGRLTGGRLDDLSTEPADEPAQIRLTMTSDDLVALVDGELAIASAWATGRIKIDASLLDLIKLRSLTS